MNLILRVPPSLAYYEDGDFLICERAAGKSTVMHDVGPLLEVEARACGAGGGGYSRVVRFKDLSGQDRRLTILDADLHNNFPAVIGDLTSQGYDLRLGLRHHHILQGYLVQRQPTNPALATIAEENGWDEGAKGLYYLNGTEVIAKAEMNIVPSRNIEAAGFHARKGTLDGWKTEVAARCEGNPTLMLAVMLALSGPFFSLLSAEALGINLVGPSGCGKSTSLYAGATVWGNPRKGRFVRSAQSTLAGFSEMTRLLNDCALFLDELGEVDPRLLGKLIYLSVDGAGKNKLQHDRRLEAASPSRVVTLSTGEINTDIVLGRADGIMDPGQVVRLGNVNIADLCPNRPFQHLHGEASVGAFLQKLADAREAHFGHAGPALVEHVLEDIDGTRALALKERDRFVREMSLKDEPSRLKERFAAFLGAVVASASCAHRAGIISWAPEESFAAMARVFDAWSMGVEMASLDPMEAAYQHVRDLIDQYGDTKFIPFSEAKDEKAPRDIWGYRHFKNDKMRYLVLSPVFKSKVFAKDISARQLANLLRDRGVLLCDDGFQLRERFLRKDQNEGKKKRKQKRYYCITDDILELFDEPEPFDGILGERADREQVAHQGVFKDPPDKAHMERLRKSREIRAIKRMSNRNDPKVSDDVANPASSR